MSCKFVCDGCGKEEPATWNSYWFKPSGWIEQVYSLGILSFCCKVCQDQKMKLLEFYKKEPHGL